MVCIYYFLVFAFEREQCGLKIGVYLWAVECKQPIHYLSFLCLNRSYYLLLLILKLKRFPSQAYQKFSVKESSFFISKFSRSSRAALAAQFFLMTLQIENELCDVNLQHCNPLLSVFFNNTNPVIQLHCNEVLPNCLNNA